jgi:hypothetical protein
MRPNGGDGRARFEWSGRPSRTPSAFTRRWAVATCATASRVSGVALTPSWASISRSSTIRAVPQGTSGSHAPACGNVTDPSDLAKPGLDDHGCSYALQGAPPSLHISRRCPCRPCALRLFWFAYGDTLHAFAEAWRHHGHRHLGSSGARDRSSSMPRRAAAFSSSSYVPDVGAEDALRSTRGVVGSARLQAVTLGDHAKQRRQRCGIRSLDRGCRGGKRRPLLPSGRRAERGERPTAPPVALAGQRSRRDRLSLSLLPGRGPKRRPFSSVCAMPQERGLREHPRIRS